MSQREIEGNSAFQESFPPEVTRGYTYLTHEESNLIRLRSRVRRETVSHTIQDLVEPAVDELEKATVEERNSRLQIYFDQIITKSARAAEVFGDYDGGQTPFVEVYWVLPKVFVDRLSMITSRRMLSNEAMMSCILSNAINIGDILPPEDQV